MKWRLLAALFLAVMVTLIVSAAPAPAMAADNTMTVSAAPTLDSGGEQECWKDKWGWHCKPKPKPQPQPQPPGETVFRHCAGQVEGFSNIPFVFQLEAEYNLKEHDDWAPFTNRKAHVAYNQPKLIVVDGPNGKEEIGRIRVEPYCEFGGDLKIWIHRRPDGSFWFDYQNPGGFRVNRYY